MLLVPTTASLEVESRDELSHVEKLGQIWAGMAGGTARDSSPKHLLCPRGQAKPDSVTARLLQKTPVFNGSGTKTHSPRNQDKSNWDKRDR